MTISALLSKLGSRTPIFVTVNGLIVGGADVAQDGNAYHHAAHGRVTPVAKHTFHDGDDPVPHDAQDPWWEQEPQGVEAERTNMALAFPEFTEIEKAGRSGWSGTIDTGRGKFLIEVLHRHDHGLPAIEVLRPRRLERSAGRRMIPAPHLYTSGKICVARTEDWDPTRHDAVTAIAWAAHWLAAYTQWRVALRWPTAGAQVEAA
jgi:hypothetical protein